VADDEERLTGMYDQCRQRVWAYVVSRAGRQVADEVVSETFAIAWRLDDVPEPALPWLLGVARNVAIEQEVRAKATGKGGTGVVENRLIFNESTGDALATESVVVKPGGLQAAFTPGTV